MDVMAFLSEADGAYRVIDAETTRDIIDALFDGRYRVVRSESGLLVGFTSWWMIRESDIDTVKAGHRPLDISGGSIVYIADHAGVGCYPDLIRFIRTVIGKKGVCWHHKFKHPRQFRYYPKKEGINA